MDDPLRVSVVILNHNYEQYVADAISSALNQTHSDVEVVVVDDGSTDDSREVIHGFGDRVAVVHQANGGQGSAMNAGLAASSGDVVLFLDADDRLRSEAAEQVARIFADDGTVAWVMFRLRIVGAQGAPLDRVRPRRSGVMPNGDLKQHLVRYRCFHWQPTSGSAYARWALERVMPMPTEEYRISADAYLAGVVPLVGPVRSLDDVLGDYRIHGRSNFTSAQVDDRYFREQIRRLVATHRHAVAVGAREGIELPSDPLVALDAAFLEFRLSSLLLAPSEHPFPGERRRRLALQGIRAAATNPQLAAPARVRRCLWFLAAGTAPRALHENIVGRAIDTPAARARRWPHASRAR